MNLKSRIDSLLGFNILEAKEYIRTDYLDDPGDSERLWLGLVTSYRKTTKTFSEHLLILSDSIEELGDQNLAKGIRWLASNRRKPSREDENPRRFLWNIANDLNHSDVVRRYNSWLLYYFLDQLRTNPSFSSKMPSYSVESYSVCTTVLFNSLRDSIEFAATIASYYS